MFLNHFKILSWNIFLLILLLFSCFYYCWKRDTLFKKKYSLNVYKRFRKVQKIQEKYENENPGIDEEGLLRKPKLAWKIKYRIRKLIERKISPVYNWLFKHGYEKFQKYDINKVVKATYGNYAFNQKYNKKNINWLCWRRCLVY